MKFSNYYYENSPNDKKSFLPDPSSVGKTSTGPRFWQQDDYIINRWIKKGILHLAKALGTKIKAPNLIRNRKVKSKVSDFTFREVNRIGFDTLGGKLSTNYMEPTKTKNYITGINKLDLTDVDNVSKSVNVQEVLSSDVYTTNNSGKIVLLSVLNDVDEIQYFIGATDKTRPFFIEIMGKSFDAFASSKKTGQIRNTSKRPSINRDEDDGYSLDDKIKIALTGDTIPKSKPSDDDISIDDGDENDLDSTDIENNPEDEESTDGI